MASLWRTQPLDHPSSVGQRVAFVQFNPWARPDHARPLTFVNGMRSL